MERHAVESSVIKSIGCSVVLEVEFESGRVYQYFDVPIAVYLEFLTAESKGKYFNAHIRNEYPYQEIELKTGTRRNL